MSIDTGKPTKADAAIDEVLHGPSTRVAGIDPGLPSLHDQDTMRQMLLQELQECLRNERATPIVGRTLCAAGCATISFSAGTGLAATVGLAVVVFMVVSYWLLQQNRTRSQIRVLEKWLLSRSEAADTFIRWKWEANGLQANPMSLLLRAEPMMWMSLTCIITLIISMKQNGLH